MEDTITSDVSYCGLSLGALGRAIYRDWKNVNYAAAPYLAALCQLDSVDDSYGYDSGQSIIRYFLSNASSWRGTVAKAIKAELKRRVGVK
jgi:hypothetical protein